MPGTEGHSDSIPGDVECSVCGYNLRTMSILGACPECGNAVLRSVEFCRHLDRLNCKRLFWGSILLGLFPAFDLAARWWVRLIVTLDRPFFLAIGFGHIIWNATCLCLGIVLLARSKPHQRGRLIAIFCFSYPIFVFALSMAQMTIIVVPAAHVRLLTDAIAPALYVALIWEVSVCVIGMFFMREYGNRMNRSWFTGLSLVVFSTLVVVSSYSLFMESFYLLGNTPWHWSVWWYGKWHATNQWCYENGLETLHFYIKTLVQVVYWPIVAIVALQSRKRGKPITPV